MKIRLTLTVEVSTDTSSTAHEVEQSLGNDGLFLSGSDDVQHALMNAVVLNNPDETSPLTVSTYDVKVTPA